MDERSPLLGTATVRLRPVHRHYRHNVCRRFCAIALCSIVIYSILSSFFMIAFDPDFDHGNWFPFSARGNLTHEQLQEILLRVPSAKMAKKWSKYYTSGPHLTGQNYSQAVWTQERWAEFGVQSEIVSYDVYLNYPVDHRLAMLKKGKKDSSDASTWKVSYEASLTEPVLDEDSTSGLEDRIPTFHGYSANGNVTAPFVYVNYGTYQDYDDLVKANVSLEGKIAIARYGGIFRGLKVKRAQELGMVGVVLFTDPGDDGDVTAEKGVAEYPDGPARHPRSVQRGSAQFLSIAPGDPTTPGYPSKPGAPRQPTDHVMAKIPSIPISFADAVPILQALNGHGPNSADFNKYWTMNQGLSYKGVDYNIGPSPDDVILNLYNEQNYVTTPLWNVIGVINGTIPDEVIVIGNHRDAWIAGGAGDPNSGSAVIMETIRAFGEALNAGWKPTRTIVFASWDGEEYALIGSTEWVEEYLPWLSAASVAYVNVDVGTAGPRFTTAAAPLLNKVLREATHLVPSPNQTVAGQTIGDLWDGHIRTMGSGSDFTAFQDFAGIPCIDMGFKGGPTDPVYQYHSNYDSFHWMETYGDPGFKYHKAMAQLLSVITAELADSAVVPLNATDYADALASYVNTIEDKLAHVTGEAELNIASLAAEEEILSLRASTHNPDMSITGGSSGALKLTLVELRRSIGELREKAVELDERSARLEAKANEHIPWWKFWEWLHLMIAIRRTNGQYKHLERHFLYPEGLDGRPWFKHVVFAPGIWTGYAGATFPGLVESIDDKDFTNAIKWANIIANCIDAATKSLR